MPTQNKTIGYTDITLIVNNHGYWNREETNSRYIQQLVVLV